MTEYIYKIAVKITQSIFLIIVFFLFDYIYQSLIHIPWLVFLIFVYFLFIGIKALKDRTVPIYQYSILPIALSVWIFSEMRGFNFCNFMSIIGLSFGQAFSPFLISYGDIKIDHQNNMITLPGSATTLILLMLIFVIKYAFWYLYALNPFFIAPYAYLETTLFAFISGVFIGRLVHILRVYTKKKAFHQLIFDLFCL